MITSIDSSLLFSNNCCVLVVFDQAKTLRLSGGIFVTALIRFYVDNLFLIYLEKLNHLFIASTKETLPNRVVVHDPKREILRKVVVPYFLD